MLFEGTPQETAWSGRKLCDEWHTAGLARGVFVDASEERWGTGLTHLTAFSAQPQAPLAVKCNVRPSGVVAVVQMLRQIDKDVSFQAHAGSGIVKAVFSTWPKGGLSRAMTQLLQPACAKHDGNAVILSNPSGNEVTRQSVWGVLAISTQLHARIKEQFDPRDILNPGRFVY